ncbi:hypothetical protein [Serpentinicella alkaliphila]|uniref:Uncharacterized protein n=1 Tax=Serpentinicella alkaliphila TaxID=1734049 RepID=A0A4R2U5E4_9FIRM|nr:hypothetical protein [Serpentinicella alkaliphila]QUH26621.1 hypothetical protein HZR23_13410 [Serpentinicella alkaliphila]TCQ02913.1 hypothetical protein EDD79_101243 [Serpentinicella alkaliphila]
MLMMIGLILLFINPPLGIVLMVFAYLRQMGDEHTEEVEAQERYEAYKRKKEREELSRKEY